jgi:hypothetical protein
LILDSLTKQGRKPEHEVHGLPAGVSLSEDKAKK